MTTCDLILYLTPAGRLAEQCDDFLRESAERFGTNEAHGYPPHVTLTGFFHRRSDRVAAVIADFDRVSAACRVAPAGAVQVVGLRRIDGWVGLEIVSPWAEALAARFIAWHLREADDDAVRPKDWLHLSLAYGLRDGRDPSDLAALAAEMVDPAAPVEWRAGLWRRHADGSWTALTGP